MSNKSIPIVIAKDPTLFDEYSYDGAYCGNCYICCQKSVIPLYPDLDDMKIYDKVLASKDPEVWIINQRENGDCIYLENRRCQVHDNPPILCRSFDCRLTFIHKTMKPEAVNDYSDEIIKKGKIQNRRNPLVVKDSFKSGRDYNG